MHTTVPATCTLHGCAHFCNLRIRREGATIALDPHVDGSCVVVFDEDEATEMLTAVASWLGLKVVPDEPAVVLPLRPGEKKAVG
jgi:hypothetical protein